MADLIERGTRPVTEKQIEMMRDEAKKLHGRAVKLHNDGVE
jgi:serine kinase of HPr protein (carbohydrate metabolism regulator)